MTLGKVHMTEHFKRYRQEEPSHFDYRSFRVKHVSPETEIIIGCPKGHYAHGHCTVGTRVQSILKKR